MMQVAVFNGTHYSIVIAFVVKVRVDQRGQGSNVRRPRAGGGGVNCFECFKFFE